MSDTRTRQELKLLRLTLRPIKKVVGILLRIVLQSFLMVCSAWENSSDAVAGSGVGKNLVYGMRGTSYLSFLTIPGHVESFVDPIKRYKTS